MYSRERIPGLEKLNLKEVKQDLQCTTYISKYQEILLLVVKINLFFNFSFGNVEDDKSAIYKFPKVTHVQQKTDSFVWNLLSTVDLFTKGEDESVIIPESGSFSVLTGKDMKLRMDSDDKCNFDLKHEVVALKKQV